MQRVPVQGVVWVHTVKQQRIPSTWLVLEAPVTTLVVDASQSIHPIPALEGEDCFPTQFHVCQVYQHGCHLVV